MATFRVTAVQSCAGPDRAANLGALDQVVSDAAAGADLVVLPELFSLLGPSAELRQSREPVDGPTVRWAAGHARDGGAWLLAGSILEKADDRVDDRGYNTAVLLDPAGEVAATYRKIHLFDNDVVGAAYRESTTVAAGDDLAVADLPLAGGLRIGIATCYDLRFPELFRGLALAGAQVVLVPAAFTAVTGAAHWEVLLRARAIENQCYVVAAGQWGMAGNGIECYGRSMVVDPWGEVLARRDDGLGPVSADIDLSRVQEVRRQLPSLANRRPDVYEGFGRGAVT